MDLITLKQQNKKAFEVSIRGHRLVVDMNRADGGDDKGPSPAELVATALAACVGMITYEYSVNHGLPSEGIKVNIVPQLEKNPTRISNFTIDLTLPADFPEDRRQAIQHAARHCVVYNTMKQQPEIDLEID